MPTLEYIKYFSQNMSNNYQYKQDHSKPLFTKDIFQCLQKYFDDKPINHMSFSEYKKLKFYLEIQLNYLAEKINKRLSRPITKKIKKNRIL